MSEKTYQNRMLSKLTAALDPIHLEIKDDSKKHAGHTGARPEGETHFSILIVSPHFEGISKVARHRLVYGILQDEIREHVHALSLATLTEFEYTHR